MRGWLSKAYLPQNGWCGGRDCLVRSKQSLLQITSSTNTIELICEQIVMSANYMRRKTDLDPLQLHEGLGLELLGASRLQKEYVIHDCQQRVGRPGAGCSYQQASI